MSLLYDPSSLPSYQSVFLTFLRLHPEYESTSEIDSLRWSDYPHLDQGHHCFDYTGTGIFSSSHGLDFGLAYTSAGLATHALYADEATLEGVMRRRVLAHMQLKEKDYCVVFAADAFSALRLLVETYPFHTSKKLLLGYDFENKSLSRISQTAQERGARVTHANLRSPGFEIEHEGLRRKLRSKKKGLFAYPLTSRVTGAKNSVSWIREARSNGWGVLLDVTSTGTDFGEVASLSPDFLVGSFYKVFGMDPSGFGCLVIKKKLLPTLDGVSKCGMVKMVYLKRWDEEPDDVLRETKENLSFFRDKERPERHEKAAVLSLEQTHEHENISSTTLTWNKSLLTRLMNQRKDNVTFPGLDHAESFAAFYKRRQEPLLVWLRDSFDGLRHDVQGQPHLVHIHSPLDSVPVLAFSLVDSYGNSLDANVVQRLANRSNISLATGVVRLVNETVGAGERYETFSVLCATLNFLTSLRDVYQLWEFIAQFLDSSFCSRELLKYRGLNQETVIL